MSDSLAQTSDSFIVEYTDFVPTKMIGLTPEEKTVPTNSNQTPAPNGQVAAAQTYKIVPINYNYGSEESPRLENFYLQLPAMKCFGGITAKPNMQGRLEYSLYCPLPQSDPTLKQCAEVLHEVYMSSARIIGHYKKELKLLHFVENDPKVSGYENRLVHYPKDKITQELIPGKTPALYLKLVNRTSGSYTNQTLFTGIDGKSIDWKLLYNVDMTIIPLFHIERIYRGSTTSLQAKTISAIVLNIEQKGSTSLQLGTISRVLSNNPSMLDKFRSQIESLTHDKQDQLVSSSSTTSDSDTFVSKLSRVEMMSNNEDDGQSTEESNKPTMHKLNLGSSLPSNTFTSQLPAHSAQTSSGTSVPSLPSMPTMPSMIPNVSMPVRPSARTTLN